jgi:2',3'-cyclic-nucleotide 2'-phosphodiesterase (5'-nucleotidase family)
MKSVRYGIFIIIGAGLWACSSVSKRYVQRSEIVVSNGHVRPSPEVVAFIAPYGDSLEVEMNRVIGFATANFERARPEGALGNLLADLSLQYALENGLVNTSEHPICLLNHGGLRSPISAGPVTVGDIYKLMPFDNTLVVLKLNRSVLPEIHAYLKQSGGEPISGFEVTNAQLLGIGAEEVVTVVTSNYLALGGDNMDFFKQPLSKIDHSKLLRDIIIEYVEATDTIAPLVNGRIRFLQHSAVLGAGVALSPSVLAYPKRPDSLRKITILHTNDTHSNIETFPETHATYPGRGGIALRHTLIQQIRREEKNVLLFDAGDIFQGTPYFNKFNGTLEMKLMSMLGYDCATMISILASTVF